MYIGPYLEIFKKAKASDLEQRDRDTNVRRRNVKVPKNEFHHANGGEKE